LQVEGSVVLKVLFISKEKFTHCSYRSGAEIHKISGADNDDTLLNTLKLSFASSKSRYWGSVKSDLTSGPQQVYNHKNLPCNYENCNGTKGN
jgi:hypothetical protein